MSRPRLAPQTWTVEGALARAEISGRTATIDAADLPIVADKRWSLVNGRYANTETGLPRPTLMHRLLLGLERGDGLEADHRNHDTLDNRRSNLRVTGPSGNRRNARKKANSSMRYKGCAARGARFCAYIRVGPRKLYLGIFTTEEAAARAYDDAAMRHFGAFACLNFPTGAV